MFRSRTHSGDGLENSVTLYISHRWINCAVILAAYASVALAALEAPQDVGVRDSLSSSTDKGTELLKQEEYVGWSKQIGAWQPALILRWRTEWQTPPGGRDRVRQDGRWYSGVARDLTGQIALWGGASGEHFDDRPLSSAGSITRSRIIRGGAGLRIEPAAKIGLSAAAGIVEDARLERTESGVGIWTRSEVRDLSFGGYLQSLTLEINRESPTNHRNRDFISTYRLYREFSPGNANELTLDGSQLERDLYLGSLGFLSHRTDQKLAVHDQLTYQSGRMLRIQLIGDLIHDQTDQSEVSDSVSTLEENQGMLAIRLESIYRQSTAVLEGKVRTITQTVRGDILQGNKTNLSWTGRTRLPDRSALEMRLAVSKYQLNTRSEDNNADRDELEFLTETNWSRWIGRNLRYEVNASVQLDHLVYLQSQFSANNRWTRLFLLTSNMRYALLPDFHHFLRADLGTTYFDYDFDLLDRGSKSTIHRRLTLADSARLDLDETWTAVGFGSLQLEEFGRLFWESFEEQRTDVGRVKSALIEMQMRFAREWSAGAGLLWDDRIVERFSEEKSVSREIYQHIESLGPTWMIQRRSRSHANISVRGQAVRRVQLDKDDRWILTGDALLSWTW